MQQNHHHRWRAPISARRNSNRMLCSKWRCRSFVFSQADPQNPDPQRFCSISGFFPRCTIYMASIRKWLCLKMVKCKTSMCLLVVSLHTLWWVSCIAWRCVLCKVTPVHDTHHGWGNPKKTCLHPKKDDYTADGELKPGDWTFRAASDQPESPSLLREKSPEIHSWQESTLLCILPCIF